MTKIHNSATCTAGFNSRPCEMCRFAEKAAQRAEHEEIASPRTENVLSGQEMLRIDPYEYLRTFKYAPPDAELAQPTEITVPTFDQEWQDAPKWATRTTEEVSANYWFIRGQHAKEVELVTLLNLDLAAMVRVARERVIR